MKVNKLKLVLLPILVILNMSVMMNITYAQIWKFAVISDTHDVDKARTTTGVTVALSPIINFIIEENPDMVIETGDLITGAFTKATSPVYRQYDAQYEAFQKIVEPLQKANIPLFVIRGNHDYGVANEEPEVQQAYIEAFANKMPQNGPADAKGLSYSFVHKDIKFIMVDQYVNATNEAVTLPMNWLEKELKSKQGVHHIFVMGHSPAYYIPPTNGAKGEADKFNLFDDLTLRDQFWELLVKNKVDAYLCGHKHVYFRGNVKGIEQICIGDLGASRSYNPKNADASLTDLFPTHSVASSENRPGYIIFTVDSDNDTMTANEYWLDSNNNKFLYDTYQITRS